MMIVGLGIILFVAWIFSAIIYNLFGQGAYVVAVVLVGGSVYLLLNEIEKAKSAAQAATWAAQQEERRQQEVRKKEAEAKQREWEATEQQAVRDKLREYLAALRAYALRLKPNQDNSRMLHAMHASLDQLQSDSDIKKKDCLDLDVQSEVQRITTELKSKGLDNDMVMHRLQEAFGLTDNK